MKKRAALVLFLLLFCGVFLPAGEVASASYGPVFAVSVPFDDEAAGNIHMGVEMRANVMWADFSFVGSYVRYQGDVDEFSGFWGFGFANRSARVFRVAFEIGPRFRLLSDDGEYYYADADGDLHDDNSYYTGWNWSPVAYRITFDWTPEVKQRIAYGVYYMVDSTYTFHDWERFRDLFDINWDSGKIGVSVRWFFL